jgi:acetoin utilization protein AcuB
MFSIYGVTGPVFSGTLEEMNRVRAASRARAVRAILEDGEELGIEVGAGMAAGAHEAAVRAYRAMLPRDPTSNAARSTTPARSCRPP